MKGAEPAKKGRHRAKTQNNIFYFENTTPKEKVKSNIVVTALWAE